MRARELVEQIIRCGATNVPAKLAQEAINDARTPRWQPLSSAPINDWVFGRRKAGQLPVIVRRDFPNGAWYDASGCSLVITHWYPIPLTEEKKDEG